MVQDKLIEIGLSEKEAAVYVAALQLGLTSVQQLADRSKVNRTTVYPVIESLMKMGLMSSIEKEEKTFYVAESPENIKRVIDKQKLEIEKKEMLIASAVNELMDLENIAGEKPLVRYYDTYEGINSAMMRNFSKPKHSEVFSLSRMDTVMKLFPNQKEIGDERVRNKIKAKFIYTTENGPIPNDTDPAKYREAVYVDLKDNDFNGELVICDNKLVMISYSNPMAAVSIESSEMVKMFNVLFRHAWDGLRSEKKAGPTKQDTAGNVDEIPETPKPAFESDY